MFIPIVAWYLVMTNAREEEYPKWLQRIFNQSRFGKMIENILIFLAVIIVLYMIIFFRLPLEF
ncbi:hypothetical protein LCGC14_0641630 [marine sediment metagenome]|uniref:Uncharacterized protein n=1 Tax=marine sediment metagenome TaxID=412755 RepID=A0A0F9U7G6_9ZZZZ